MIIFDNHENYLLTQFEIFCKEKNIIIFYFLTYSSHLTQPLDISCFNILKRSYNKEIESFIKTHINYITKPEFFIIFKAVHFATMISKNIRAGFRSISLMPYNPQVILSKLDIKLRTPTPTGPPLLEANPWVSQTPHGPAEAIL